MPDGKETQAAQGSAAKAESPDGQVNASDEAVKSENHLRQLIAERDHAKAKLKELEAAAEAARQKEIEEKGLYKAELEKLKPEYENLKTFKQAYDTRLTEQVAALEGKLSKDNSEEYESFIKRLDLESRRAWLERKAASPSAPAESPANGRPGATGKTQAAVKAMTFEERMELYRKDADAFKKVI